MTTTSPTARPWAGSTLPVKVNPYIAGNPVGAGSAFVGRADVSREVARVAASPHENALVLYGQRRIGKTSLLQELTARLSHDGPYRPIYIDLQDKAALPLPRVLEELAARIAQGLGQPAPPRWGEDAERAFRDDFIAGMLDAIPTDVSLVLLIDEFDVLDSPVEAQAGASFFPYLRALLSLNPQRLRFVFVIGRRPEDLSSLTLSVFKGIKSLHVSLLPPEEAAQLVRLSERDGSLEWSDEAVARVLALTGGHPFVTQQLCQLIWEQAYTDTDETKTPASVQAADVEATAPVAIRSATNALEWLWDGLGPAERLVASTLAGAGPTAITQDGLEKRLSDSGVRILIGELQEAPRILQEWDLIERVEGGYQFRVELLRRWIAERKPLARVQEEMDRIQPVAENLFQASQGLYRGGQLDQAVINLRQAVVMNPNHVRANQLLAEILLAQGAVAEARQLLERLFEYQPAAARPRLVQALLLQAQAAGQDEERIGLYDRALQVDPSQPEAKSGRQRIWRERGEAARAAGRLDEALEAFRRADLPEQVAEVETVLQQQRLKLRLEELAALEQKYEYTAALELARHLHQEFPERVADLPSLEQLERKTHVHSLYKQGTEALQAGDRLKAEGFLAQVVALEPHYQESTRYLHLAVTGIDVAELQRRPTLTSVSLLRFLVYSGVTLFFGFFLTGIIPLLTQSFIDSRSITSPYNTILLFFSVIVSYIIYFYFLYRKFIRNKVLIAKKNVSHN
jgi:tetratricopeptide (TPR) repeat protein